ncbi:MAG: glycosyltransferase [Bacteroidales bacterium]|jgi:cellulose synthase/poly-beta-1,6-N-acetylglucosamine synthase-like glycosyltransferase|nr:glycosyltransferase [Bacteroidales bacterium]
MAGKVILLISFLLLAWTYLLWPATVMALAAAKRRTAGKKIVPKTEEPPPVADSESGKQIKEQALARAHPEATLQLRATTEETSRDETSPLPSVSVIMSAFNEEKVIREKMTSLLASDYPSDLIEFLVGSDCSGDGTDRILEEFAATDTRIRYFRSSERKGKASMLNKLASEARGELLVVTDANVIFSPQTVRELVGSFGSKATGLCDATVIPGRSDGSGVTRQENFYSRFETALKRAEGELWGAMPGPYGGCYAVRRDLFPEIPPNTLVDDLYAGLAVLAKGYRSFNIPGATVFEDTQPDMKDQFRRRIRIAAGSFQNLFRFGPFPSKRFSASFVFVSHKVLRWFSPLLLALFFMTTVILSGHSDFYLCLTAVQLIFIILSAIDLLPAWRGKKVRYQRFITQFLMMNVALAAGFVKALRGIKSGIWEPTKRV